MAAAGVIYIDRINLLRYFGGVETILGRICFTYVKKISGGKIESRLKQCAAARAARTWRSELRPSMPRDRSPIPPTSRESQVLKQFALTSGYSEMLTGRKIKSRLKQLVAARAAGT